MRAIRDTTVLKERLKDARSGRVIFLSHCILNENTRYLGGAFRKGCIREIVSKHTDDGLGLVQMPCPEEEAWGGVLKKYLLTVYGSSHGVLYRFRNLLLPLFLFHTRFTYRRLAAKTAKRIKDYLDSGFSVVGIVGVDGSPSCGVAKTLDIRKSFDMLASLNAETVTPEDMNELIRACVTEGRGLFTAMLIEELRNMNIAVPYTAHSLIEEMDEPRP